MEEETKEGFFQQDVSSFKSGSVVQLSSSGSSGFSPMGGGGNYYNSPGGDCVKLDCSPSGRMIYSPGGVSSQSALLLDTVPGLKHDTGFAVEWSVEEQYKLEEGLAKYANEPNIMRYIKIAATIPNKTVRDVALRCRWMTRKRRPQDDQNMGKKGKDKKDKLSDSSLRTNMSSSSPMNMGAYGLTNNHCQIDNVLSGVSGITRRLLEENNQAFGQISANISTLKLQENFDLFFRARNNITKVLEEMRNTPGILSRMPPLPVFINEELASSIMPHPSQTPVFGPSSSIPLKQEPGS